MVQVTEFGPVDKRGHCRGKCMTQLCQGVLHPRRHLWINGSVNDVVLLQPLQLLDKHLLRDVGNELLQFGKPSRLKTHLFPLIGARAIVDLDTHDLMRPLEAIKKRGTIDVALRVQNYLQSIMREAKRLRIITVNPAYDLVGSIKASRVVHRAPLYPYRACLNCRNGSDRKR